jgi:hypothetical protein
VSRSRVEAEKYGNVSWDLKVKFFESSLILEGSSELIRNKITHRSVNWDNTKPIKRDTRGTQEGHSQLVLFPRRESARE